MVEVRVVAGEGELGQKAAAKGVVPRADAMADGGHDRYGKQQQELSTHGGFYKCFNKRKKN